MTRRTDAKSRDIHAEITQRLIELIETNPGMPQMPWRKSGKPLWMPQNALTSKLYSGVNILSLWVAAELRGFASPVYATYRQWQEKGCQVRRGERAELVVFYKNYSVDPKPDSPDDDGQRRVARASYVFNSSQVEGWIDPPEPEPLPPLQRIEAADRFFANTGIKILHEGERAYYRPSTDMVVMPREELFCGTDTMTREEGYYSVLGHECCHATGHKSRLNRDLTGRFGSDAYAAEELVAAIGEAYICAELGITPEPRPDHAMYLANWLKILKGDNKAIFTAAAKASEAINYLKSLQPSATAARSDFDDLDDDRQAA